MLKIRELSQFSQGCSIRAMLMKFQLDRYLEFLALLQKTILLLVAAQIVEISHKETKHPEMKYFPHIELVKSNQEVVTHSSF
tara:strand:- start:551 stop:796 length:246 start_codon:yes stop_codon:yes gene_type:complete